MPGDPVWSKLFGERTWGEYPSEEAVRFVKRAVARAGRTGEALDIGAGQGACAWMLQREGFRVTCLEGAREGVDAIPRTVQSFGRAEAPELLLGDICAPARALPGRAFDLMLDHYALYANAPDEIAHALGEYFSLLRPGGHLLICCFGKGTTGYGTGRRLGPDTFADMTEGNMAGRGLATLFDREGLSSLVSAAGFGIVYTERIELKQNSGVTEKLVLCAGRS